MLVCLVSWFVYGLFHWVGLLVWLALGYVDLGLGVVIVVFLVISKFDYSICGFGVAVLDLFGW